MEDFGYPPKFPEFVEEVATEPDTDSIPKDKSKGFIFKFSFYEVIFTMF